MSTEPRETANDQHGSRGNSRTGWGLPLFSLAMGGVRWAASWVGGHPLAGLVSFVIMAAFGAVFVLGGAAASRTPPSAPSPESRT
jgi:Flp pilus assembly protein TadB